MCFFDQFRYLCGDWKWGHFRQHCNREYRMGETCGMKLIMTTIPVNEKCKVCEKIDVKMRRRQAEAERVNRWAAEGNKFRASIEKACELIQELDSEIYMLQIQRQERAAGIGAQSYSHAAY